MKTFTVYRPLVPTDTHDENQRNAPDEPQFQGVVFDSGTCVIHWLTKVNSTSVFDSFDDMMKIHGHPEYDTKITWDNQ